MTPSGPPALTFVFPCLNEEKTLAPCITAVRASLDPAGVVVVVMTITTAKNQEKEK